MLSRDSWLLDTKKFRSCSKIEASNSSGLYAIRICDPKNFHSELSGEVSSTKDVLIYIGKASKSLKVRLEQELRGKGHGTFFRSIGAVLGYKPKKGSLKDKSNKNNFKFSEKGDQEKIIKWVNSNLFYNYKEEADGIEEKERKLIEKYQPLLNLQNNTNKSSFLQEKRKKCLELARG